MRKWIIPLAVLLVVPALGAAAPISIGPSAERLVEGHTVFTVMQAYNNTTIDEVEYAAAVAVLVREQINVDIDRRFPGVLWFNDQYLVNPYNQSQHTTTYRYPCTGAVLAVNAGAADPRGAAAGATYVESYAIVDPNDNDWTVDKWTHGVIGTIWSVALLNNQVGYAVPDDGGNCAPYDESGLLPIGVPCVTGGGGNVNFFPLRCNDQEYINGETAVGGTVTPVTATKYNAVLYFRLVDLTVAGTDKDHNPSMASGTSADSSGCDDDPAVPEWPCPGGDDNAEGDSHPYNPFGSGLCVAVCAGAGNHGGSGAGGVYNTHATRNIDLYYDAWTAPLLRTMYLVDTVGSLAPFHDH